MSGTISSPSHPIFGPRRNSLTSKWDILFDEDPKEWIGFKPSLGLYVYPCYSCRDMFSSKRSFQDHINRRIMVLKYNCASCSEILTFYNRCSFLLHTRRHYTLNGGEVNLCELDIFSLPVALAGFLPHPNVPFLFDVEEEVVPGDTYLNAQFYSPHVSQRGQQVVALKPNDIIFRQPLPSLALKQICKNIPKCEFITVESQQSLRQQNLFAESNDVQNTVVGIKQEPVDEPEQEITIPIISKVESLKDKVFKLPRCLECNTFQRGTMAEHYLGKEQPGDSSLKCSICRFVAPTKCSLKAHIRIHETIPPFVCPDCGKDFPNYALLSKHMDEVCFHLAKHVRFRCPGKKCGKLFAMSSTFAAHFQVHLKCFYTCSICSTVLFKIEDADVHQTLHDEPCSFRKVYDCSLCTHLGTLTEENVKEHVDIHTTDTTRCTYVYLCRYCRSYFRSTTTYATHVLRCSTKQTNTASVKKFDTPRYVTRTCESCPNKIIFSDDRPVKVCNKCKVEAQKAKSMSSKRYFCVLCNKQILLHEKCSHMQECKYGRPIIMVPKLTMADVETVSFSSSSSEMDSSNSPTKFEGRKHRLIDLTNDDNLKKKRRRYTYINNNKVKKNDVQFDLTADEPMQFNGTYHCKVCEYEDTDRAKFHNHIKEHRDISTAYQCMECAECFVVKPSLVKHLLHYHNITDFESYLKDNDCYDITAVKELEDLMRLAPGESKEPVKENQCRVCRQQFEDGTALNKHFRIHGMAFLLKNIK